MRRLRLAAVLFSLVFAVLTAGAAHAVAIQPGDILVTGSNAAGTFVARVDPVSGAQQIVTQGGLLTSPFCLAVAKDGFIYVGNQVNIIKVNPANGVQVKLLDLTTLPFRQVATSVMVAHSDGNLYYSGTGGDVIRLDPVTAALTQVSSQAGILGLTEGPDHAIYAACCLAANGISACTGASTDIVARRIDRVTGTVTNVGFGGIGKPRDLVFDARDSMYVESANDRRVFRFNQVTGAAGALPLIGNELTFSTQHMAAHSNGYIYQTHNYTQGRVDRLDPVTTNRISFSTFPSPSSLVGITIARDFSVPVTQTSWGQVKQIYR